MFLVLIPQKMMAESRRVRLLLTTLDEQSPRLTRCGAWCFVAFWGSDPMAFAHGTIHLSVHGACATTHPGI